MKFINKNTLLKSMIVVTCTFSQVSIAQTVSSDSRYVDSGGRKILVEKPRWKAVKIGGAYTDAGPTQINNGQVDGISSSSTVTGAVESIATHPSDPNQMWIATIGGGIFKTDNATAASPNWTPQTDNFSSLSMGHIDIDGSDNDILVAGFASKSSFIIETDRLGLLRTIDGGTNWNLLAGFPAGISVSGIVSEGNTIVVSTDKANGTVSSQYPSLGVFKSTDSGATFTQISDALSSNGLPLGLNYNLAQNPGSSNELYVHVKNVDDANANGIYRSVDTGSNWIKVSDASGDPGSVSLNGLLSGATSENVMISVGDSNAVFVGVCNSNSLAGLFRTVNQGVDWTELDLPSTGEPVASDGLHPGGQCDLHFSMVAHPSDTNVVFIGGDRQPALDSMGSFPNNIGAKNYTGRLFKVDASQVSGSQVTPITNCPDSSLAMCGMQQHTDTNSGPHADSRFLIFDADNNLIEADDGGVYKKPNPDTTGSSATDWVSLNGDLSVTEQHNVALDTLSDIIITGNQDTGSIEQTNTGSTTWNTIHQGDGADVAVAVSHPSALESTRFFGSPELRRAYRRVMDSSGNLTPMGETIINPRDPANINTSPVGCNGNTSAGAFPFLTPVVINRNSSTPPPPLPANKDRMLIGATNGLYYSADGLDTNCRLRDGGVNWGFGGAAMVFGIDSNPNIIYVGQSGLIRTSSTWPPVWTTKTVESGGLIRAITIDPSHEERAYAISVDSGGISKVYQTINTGSNWSEITNNLGSISSGEPTSIVFIEGTGGNGLIVGVGNGVYMAKQNQGFMSWEEVGTGLPNALVFDLHYDPEDDILTASTMGRGSYTLEGLGSVVPVNLQSFEIE